MSRTFRDITTAALVAGAITFGLGGVYIARAETGPPLPTVQVCTEEQPCWNPTMGNGNGQMRCIVTAIEGEIYLDDCQEMTA